MSQRRIGKSHQPVNFAAECTVSEQTDGTTADADADHMLLLHQDMLASPHRPLAPVDFEPNCCTTVLRGYKCSASHPWHALRVVPQRLPEQAPLQLICQAAQQLMRVLLPTAHKASVEAQQVAVQRVGPKLSSIAVQLPKQLALQQATYAGFSLPSGAAVSVSLQDTQVSTGDSRTT
jgi:hypothetical protein